MSEPEREWMRIYVDREKMSAIHNRVKEKKHKIVDFLKKLDIELMFAKLEMKNLIPDAELEDVIDTIQLKTTSYSVGEFVDAILESQGQGTSKMGNGDVVTVQAVKEMQESVRITSPTGRSLPILKRGAYLAHRQPANALRLFDGEYQVTHVVDIVDKPGNYDMIELLIKMSGADVEKTLSSWNNHHARIVGVVGTVPPYTCRIRGDVPTYSSMTTTYALYVLVLEVTSPADGDLVKRLNLWHSWK